MEDHILKFASGDIITASSLSVIIKELEDVYSDRKNCFVRTQAKFFCDAFNIYGDSCFEEFIFAANQLKINLKSKSSITIEFALYTLCKQVWPANKGKKDNELKCQEMVCKYLRPSIEQKHIQSILKTNKQQSIEYIKQKYRTMRQELSLLNGIEEASRDIQDDDESSSAVSDSLPGESQSEEEEEDNGPTPKETPKSKSKSASKKHDKESVIDSLSSLESLSEVSDK
jgi:predicted nucleotidyltransferase